MIPKSLLIAVITGILASAVTGIYLQNTNSQILTFTDGSSISLSLNKQTYHIGDPVQIELINSGTSTLVFSNEMPSIKVRALDGTVFFSASFDGEKLTPRQKYVYTWNQQKNDNSKIIEGRYIIESFVYDENRQKTSNSITLNVLK